MSSECSVPHAFAANARPMDVESARGLDELLASADRELVKSPVDRTLSEAGQPSSIDDLPPLDHEAAASDCPAWLTVGDPEAWGFNTAANQASDERRIYPRRDARGWISVARFPQGEVLCPERQQWLLTYTGVVGELIDVSRNGLAIVLLNPLPTGEEVLVRLFNATGEIDGEALARVIRAFEIGDGRWKIVAQLEDDLTFDQAYLLAHKHRLTDWTFRDTGRTATEPRG